MQVFKLFKSVLFNPWTFIVLPWAPFLLIKMLSDIAIANWVKVMLLLLQFVVPLAAVVYSHILTQTDKSLDIHFNGLLLRFSGAVFIVVMIGYGLIAQAKEDHSTVGIVLFAAFVAGYIVRFLDQWEIRSGEAKIAWAAELVAMLNRSNERIEEHQIPMCFLKNSPACYFEGFPTCQSLGMPLCDWKQNHS